MTLQLTPWQHPPARPRLDEQAVHLWRFPLDCNEPLERLLDEQELQRARRLRIADKARAFVVARARLRQILGRYLDCPPQEVCFSYGPAGKPALAAAWPVPPAFNLAHSGNWGLCALGGLGEVGVDIEQLDRSLDHEKLAAQFFTISERACLHATAEARRRRLFFRIWTRKEALLKGRGGGFSDPDRDLASAHLAGCCSHDGRWWLRSLPVARGYLAALAATHPFPLVRRWDFLRNH